MVVEKQDCEHLVGQFLDHSHYDVLIDTDTDVYLKPPATSGQTVINDESNLILSFRKGYFTKEEQAGAYDGLMEAAKPSQNRGYAAGPKGAKCRNRDWVTNEQFTILTFLMKMSDSVRPNEDDIEWCKADAKYHRHARGWVWLATEKAKPENGMAPEQGGFDGWLARTMKLEPPQIIAEASRVFNTMVSDTTYANPVDSGIAGWFDRYPRIPYGRACAYNEHEPERFKLAYPFLQHLSAAFKQHLPIKHAAQQAYIDRLDPEFYVPNTVFTTITVNKNFRTAAHRDAGDLSVGFSNLSVVAKDNDYDGAYLVLPEIRAAVNIRPGDLLLVNNHEFIHSNTPLIAKSGVELERISIVCYFREGMANLGTKEYEDLRRSFIESRANDKSHPLQRPGWNGVSIGWETSQEWYDYLLSKNRQDLLDKYHPEIKESTLDSLFA